MVASVLIILFRISMNKNVVYLSYLDIIRTVDKHKKFNIAIVEKYLTSLKNIKI